MSAIDDSYLIVTPNGYKASKLYAVKPYDGSGDLTWTRNTTSTRVNSSGLIEVVSNNVPRLDYTDVSCPCILVEPQRTNLYVNSEPVANENFATGVSYDAFSWGVGFTNCVRFGDNSALRARYGATSPSNTTVTLSCFIIMDDLGTPVLGTNSSTGDFSFVIANGIGVTNVKSINFGNGIWRISARRAVGASGLTNNGIIKYTTQSSKGFRVVGWQLEEASEVSSYIPTSGGIVTRNADVGTVTTPVGVTSIIETFEDGTTNSVSPIPVTYQMSEGRISKVVMS